MNMQFFSRRLRQERERLGLTQDAVVEKIGVSKRSYCAYEAGDTAPSAKLLTKVAAIGMDVSFLLTGQRSEGLLSVDERRLLDDFRAAPQGVQAGVKTTLEAFSVAGGQKLKKAG